MKIKIMQTNQYGKLEFTVEELEKLLSESYEEGYSDGQKSYYYTASSKTTPTITYLNDYTTTCATSNTTTTPTIELNSIAVKGSAVG